MAPVGIAARAPRFLFIDGLRGVAALAIAVHHFTANSGRREVFPSASIAVDLFFCLSGFVIAHAYHERLAAGMTLREYLARRVHRLYPLYLVGLVMGAAALALLKSRGLTNMPWGAIALAGLLNAFYIPYLNHYEVHIYAWSIPGAIFPLNNPAWSLFYGMLANLAYAATVRNSRFGPGIWMVAFAAGLPLAAYAYGTTPGWGTDNFVGGLPRVLYAFFAGVFVYRMRDRLAGFPRLHWPASLALVIGLLLVPRFPDYQLFWIASSLVLVPLLVALAARTGVAEGSVWRRAMDWSGLVSYPIFCVHYPLLMVFAATVPLDAHYIAAGLAFVALTLVIAELSRRGEDPLRRLIRRRDAER